MTWEMRNLKRGYLKKMLDKQSEYKQEAKTRMRDESLTNYLDDIKGKPSVDKKVLYGSKSWNKKHTIK